MGGPPDSFRKVLGLGFLGPRKGFFNGLEDGTFFLLGFKEGLVCPGGNFLTTVVVGEGRLALKVVFVVVFVVVLGFVVVVVVVVVVVETVVETVGLTNAAADGTGGGGG